MSENFVFRTREISKSVKKSSLKNVLELHISTQNISGEIAKAKLKQVMTTIREE